MTNIVKWDGIARASVKKIDSLDTGTTLKKIMGLDWPISGYQSTIWWSGDTNDEGDDNGTTLVSNNEASFGVTGSVYYSGYWNFKGLPIPHGANIDSAVLVMSPATNFLAQDTPIRWKCAAADNQSSPTNHTDFAAISWTSQYVDELISDAWTETVRVNSAELKTIFQAVVNRAGWVEGNNIMLGAFDNGGANNTGRRIETTGGDSTHAPHLIITFTSPSKYVNQIHVAADTGSWDTTNDFSSNTLNIGQIGGRDYRGFWRFTTIPIAQGTQISSAYLYNKFQSTWSGVNQAIDFWGNDADTGVRPTTWQTGDAMIKTTATVSKTLASEPTPSVDVGLPVITDCVQEILDRPGWASGADISFIYWRKSGDNSSIQLKPYVSTLYSLYKSMPRLEINF